MKLFPLWTSAMAACVIVAVGMPAAAQEKTTPQPIKLRYKFSTRDKLLYRAEATVEQLQTVTGKEYKNVFKTTALVEHRLDRLDKSKNFVLDREIKHLQVEVRLAQLGDYKFDSKADDNERGSTLGATLTPIYELLSGSVLKVTLTPQGEVFRVKGYKELLEPVLKDKPLAQQFVKGGSNEGQRLDLMMQFLMLSKKPVKPGDTWQTELNLELARFGSAKGKRTYKFEGLEIVNGRPLAKMTFTTDLTFSLDYSTGGMKLTGDTHTENSKGTAYFDLKNGRLVSQTEEYTTVGDLTVTADEREIAIKTKSTQTTKVNLVEKPGPK